AHGLQLASFVTDGAVLESARSSTLQVNVVATTTAKPRDTPSIAATAFTTRGGVAVRSELVTDAVDDPTDLAFVPDGRLFVAERGGHVRVVQTTDARVLPDPALSVDAGGKTNLLGLAVDPEFDRTHFVFAIYTVLSRTGAAEFLLVRLREASNTLADSVVLLDRVPAAA